MAKGRTIYQLHEVFDTGGSVPEHTYVDRANLDSKFQLYKANRAAPKPIVIVGPSRQGKTVSRKKHFPDSEAVVVTIDSQWTTDLIYAQILVELNPRLQVEVVKEASASGRVTLGGLIDVGADGSRTEHYRLRTGSLKDEVITELLAANKHATRWCVIEDCHLLPAAELRSLADGVKSMFDKGVKVVVVGAWYKRNRLAEQRDDLADRCELIQMHWTNDELKKILVKGQQALNIRFSDALMDLMVESATGLVGRLQWLAAKYCEACGITETMPDDKHRQPRLYHDSEPLVLARNELCERLAPRYIQFARKALGGFNPRNPAPEDHDTYFGDIARACFASTLLSLDQLLNGVAVYDLWQAVKKLRSNATLGIVTEKVGMINQRQLASKEPLLIRYDPDKMIRVEDYDFFFYRKWSKLDWKTLNRM